MREISWLGLTTLFFILLALLFGAPRKMDLIDRNTYIDDQCMLDDSFVTDLLNELSQIRPKMMLIGSSMLGEAVDQKQITKLTGLPTVKVWYGGSGSAWWYLVVKNIVPKIDEKPKYIGIFFRDNYLTLPQHKINGKNKKAIDMFAGNDEEILDKLAYFNSMNSFQLLMYKYFPLINRRDFFKNSFENKIEKTSAFLLGLENSGQLKDALSSSFSNNKMNPEMLHERQLADEQAQDEYRKDMSFQPEKTFLKHIIDQCRAQGISLFFVRVKRLRDVTPNHKTDENLLTYISQLNDYLLSQGVPLLDFTNDPKITRQHFGKGDHLNRKEGRKVFTARLSELIKQNLAFLDKQGLQDNSEDRVGENSKSIDSTGYTKAY